MRFIVPGEHDSSQPLGTRYCVTDSTTLISYDSDTAYYYVRASAAHGDWLFSRSSRWRDYSYSSNPCSSYASYSVSQQYTPLDFSSSCYSGGDYFCDSFASYCRDFCHVSRSSPL